MEAIDEPIRVDEERIVAVIVARLDGDGDGVACEWVCQSDLAPVGAVLIV